jgi:hypothetical protein
MAVPQRAEAQCQQSVVPVAPGLAQTVPLRILRCMAFLLDRARQIGEAADGTGN